MNHVYRVVWNAALCTWTVVSELAKSHRPRFSKLSAALLVGIAMQGQALATDYLQPVVVFGGVTGTLNSGDTVTVTNDNTVGLGVADAGSQLIANNVTVTTSGNGTSGAYVGYGGQLTLTDGSVTATGASTANYAADAVFVLGQGSRATITRTVLSTQGQNAYGVAVVGGGSASLDGAAVSTHADNSVGLYISGTGSQAMATDLTTSTAGKAAVGVEANQGASISLSGGEVTTSGDAGVGIVALETGSQISVTGVRVQTTGGLANGIGAYGVDAEGGGRITLGGGATISTQGASAIGVRAVGDGSQIAAEGITVATAGANAYDVMADGAGATIRADNSVMSTTGNAAVGIVAMNGGVVTLNGGAVGTSGNNAMGMVSTGTGSQINATDVQVQTIGGSNNDGFNAYGVYAEDGGTVNFTGGRIEALGQSYYGTDSAVVATGSGTHIGLANASVVARGANNGVMANQGAAIDISDSTISSGGVGDGYAYGVQVWDRGTRVTLSNTNIDASGVSTAGVVASNGASVDVVGGRMSIIGGGSGAVVAMDAGTHVTLRDAVLTAHGDSGAGVGAGYGAAVDLSGGSVDTFGSNSSGLIAQAEASYLTVANASITTHGEVSIGLFAVDGVVETSGNTISTLGEGSYGVMAEQATGATTIRMSGDHVITQGNGAIGLTAHGVGSAIEASNVRVQTTGAKDPSGIGAYGVDAEGGGRVMLRDGASVSTSGVGAMALLATGNGSEVATSGQVTVRSTGGDAYGALAQDGGAITLAQGANIDTSGDTAHGLVSLGADSQINATGATVETHGTQASGVALGNSTINLAGSSVLAQYTGALLSADGTEQTTNRLNMSGGSMASVADDAIRASAGDNWVNLSHGAQVTGGNGTLLDVVGTGTVAHLSATDDVVLTGDVVALAGNMAHVSLAQSSSLTGAMRNASSVSVDGSSLWNMTASSDVQQLTLAGTVAFAASPSGYKSLVVHGDLAGNGGTVALNTALNEGGALSHQYTDRVLVEGNASGTTYLKVTGSGTGALTDTNKNGVAEANEGISLAQVAGQSSASAFVLSGGYVAVGPWRYELSSYQPGSADAGQRVVAGTGNGFWDYRLQNVYVADVTPVPDPTPDPSPDDRPDVTPSRPAVVPQVPAYLSAATAMLSYGMRSIGTLHDRLGEVHQDDVSQAGNTGEFYARVFGGNYRYSSDRSFRQYGFGFDQDDRGIQIGGTWLKTDNDDSTFRMGLYGSIGTSRITPKAIDGSSAMRMDARSVAATATYVNGGGFYLDGVVARNDYRARVDTAYRGYGMASFKTRGWSYSLEAGYPFVFANELRLEPQAQVTYQSLHTNRFGDSDGLSVSPGDSGAWTGRIGASLSRTFATDTGQRWTPSARLNYVTSSASRTAVTLVSDAWDVSGTFTNGSWGSVWQLGAGVSGALTRTLSVYAGADYQATAGHAGQQGWSANLGLRWQF
ncbi:autotransporter outer membrane beta-barrel domain-containing protein [Dyella jiangningensis]|uniref:Autotransporter domain-containing protein n=1 Tax=Dyella jiangningensis TaxID=1379159 RepID=A0A328P7K0_9GAMM|nr:autotransporter outer membrane beta-barrel domain-containing protein [Dyella jiangningensis]RAO78267.1 hypothetical protein CA260_00495 [Dyella jiangningensis]